MRFRHFLSAAALALSCALVAGGASADVEAAKAFVQQKHSSIKGLVERGSPSDTVKKEMATMVDYNQLAARTFGSPCPPAVACTNHWNGEPSKNIPGLTDAQKAEVTALLQNLVEKNLQKNIGKTRDFDVQYSGAKELDGKTAKIKTQATNKQKPRDPAVQVDYVILEKDDNSHSVVDIVTEGSSMVRNYYDQFHRMLTTDTQGYPYLVQKLKDKIAAKDKEAAAAAAAK